MATFDPTDPPPTAEERYNSATNTSNLKVEARRQMPADMLIAAAWSPSRLGAALMRLHSEWDGAEKPPRPSADRIDQIIASLPLIEDGMRKDKDGQMVKNMVADVKGGRRLAHEWYMHELKILFQKLKTMPEVRQQLAIWTYLQGFADPEKHTAEVLSWWLDHTCPVCNGRGKQLIVGSPIKSHRNCPQCKGSGKTPIPFDHDDPLYAMESRQMLEHINDCLTGARASLKQRLYHGRPKKEDASA